LPSWGPHLQPRSRRGKQSAGTNKSIDGAYLFLRQIGEFGKAFWLLRGFDRSVTGKIQPPKNQIPKKLQSSNFSESLAKRDSIPLPRDLVTFDVLVES
jgi:hypothetical protein